jgi:hypothetical protein
MPGIVQILSILPLILGEVIGSTKWNRRAAIPPADRNPQETIHHRLPTPPISLQSSPSSTTISILHI